MGRILVLYTFDPTTSNETSTTSAQSLSPFAHANLATTMLRYSIHSLAKHIPDGMTAHVRIFTHYPELLSVYIEPYTTFLNIEVLNMRSDSAKNTLPAVGSFHCTSDTQMFSPWGMGHTRVTLIPSELERIRQTDYLGILYLDNDTLWLSPKSPHDKRLSAVSTLFQNKICVSYEREDQTLQQLLCQSMSVFEECVYKIRQFSNVNIRSFRVHNNGILWFPNSVKGRDIAKQVMDLYKALPRDTCHSYLCDMVATTLVWEHPCVESCTALQNSTRMLEQDVNASFVTHYWKYKVTPIFYMSLLQCLVLWRTQLDRLLICWLITRSSRKGMVTTILQQARQDAHDLLRMIHLRSDIFKNQNFESVNVLRASHRRDSVFACRQLSLNKYLESAENIVGRLEH